MYQFDFVSSVQLDSQVLLCLIETYRNQLGGSEVRPVFLNECVLSVGPLGKALPL